MISRRQALVGASAGLSLAAFGTARAQTVLAPGWRAGPDLPIAVQEIYPTVLDGTIYLAGGLSPDVSERPIDISDRFYALELGAATWTARAPLPLPIHHPNLVAHNGLIYAIGGFTLENGGAWSMSAGVRIYDPNEDTWRDGPAMPQPYGETVAAVIGDRIHVVTGRRPSGSANAQWSDHADTNAHIVFDPNSEAWGAAPPAPTARNSAAGAVLDGRLHVVGGRTVTGGNTPVHEAFDPQSRQWAQLAPLPEPRSGPHGAGGLATAAVNGRLYAFGGEWFSASGGGVYHQVWVYDPNTDAWSEVSTMPTPRHGLGAVALEDAIWTIAGAARAGGNATSAAVEVFTP